MNFAVYIPTKNLGLSKLDLSIPTYICTQPGLGNSRALCVEHAKSRGYTHILMLDDDIKIPDNYMQLFSYFEKDHKLAWVSGHNTGTNCWSGIVRNTGLKYTYSLGIQMVALDVDKVLEVGNYNKTLNKHEDTDLAIRLMKAGYYRAVDTGVIYKHTRHYDPNKNEERMFKWNKILRELKIDLNKVDQYRAHRVMLYLCAKNLKVTLQEFLEMTKGDLPRIKTSLFEEVK